MLYQFYEWQRQLSAPMENMARHAAHSLRHPLNPLSYWPSTQAMATLWDRFANTQARYEHPEFQFAPRTINGQILRVDNTVIANTAFCQLRRFRLIDEHGVPVLPPQPLGKKADDNRLILVSPISGNYAVVFNDAVSLFLNHAEIYVTDWIDPRNVPVSEGRFDLAENITHLLDFFDKVRPAHVLSFSQSANPSLIATALFTQDHPNLAPRSLTLIGGPIDTRVNAGVLSTVLDKVNPDIIDSQLIQTVPYGYAGAGRRVFPGFLQHAGFMGLHWDRQIKAGLQHIGSASVGDTRRTKKFERASAALNAVMDMCAEHYQDNLRHFFLEHSLVRGKFTYLQRPIPLTAISRSHVLVVEGERDNLCPPGQTRAAFALLPNLPARAQKSTVIKNCGHFGLVGGTHFQRTIYPTLREWMSLACLD